MLQAVARLEPRWEAQLAQVEFAVEEVPPPDETAPGPVPLARLDPGAPAGPGRAQDSRSGAPAPFSGLRRPGAAPGPAPPGPHGTGDQHTGQRTDETGGPALAASRPPRIVVYRRPLLARADGDEDLSDLLFEVVVEEFARLLGIDPEEVDPGYLGEEDLPAVRAAW